MDIDDVSGKRTALSSLAAGLSVTSAGHPPTGKSTPAAAKAANQAVADIERDLKRSATNLKAMGAVLDRRLAHMREFGKDYPSNYATVSDARAAGRKLALEFRKHGEIDIDRIATMKGDPEAVYGFIDKMSKGDLTTLLGDERYDYFREELRIIYETINEVGDADGFSDGKLRTKLVAAIGDLHPDRMLQSLRMLNDRIGGGDSGDRFHQSLVGIMAAATFSKIAEMDGQDDLGGSRRKNALDAFKEAMSQEAVAGSVMSHRDTLNQILTADVITKDMNAWWLDEDLDTDDFVHAVQDMLRRGFTPPSEAKYEAIVAATNGWQKGHIKGSGADGLAEIVNLKDPSLPNALANTLAGTLSPYLIDPDFVAARLADEKRFEGTMLGLGNALGVLGTGGGQETRDVIAGLLQIGQTMNWHQNGTSPQGARQWVAMEGLRNQMEAVFEGHGAGLRAYDNAEELGRAVDLTGRALGILDYVPTIPGMSKVPTSVANVATVYGAYAGDEIEAERTRLEDAARYEQSTADYYAKVASLHSASDVRTIAASLVQRTEGAPPDFEDELVLVLTQVKGFPLRDL